MEHIQNIYAEKSVSITDLRKDIKSYLIDEPVAVLSNNKTVGYVMSEYAFRGLVDSIIANTKRTKGTRATKEELREISLICEKYLEKLSDDDIENIEFVEC